MTDRFDPLLFSSLLSIFPPFFFPLPEKENVKFGSELRISPVCRFLSFAGKVEGRGGMEFLNLVEVSRDFSFFFFFLECVGIMWKEYGGKLLNLIERERMFFDRVVRKRRWN